MPHTVAERAMRWGMDADADADFLSIFEQIVYLADKRFHEYQPTFGPHPDFTLRLRDWLNNVPLEADQKVLFRLVPNLFFVGSKDFLALYRAAFRGPIMRWLVECQGLQFPTPDLDSELRQAIQSTWFCAISDSMEIATFYHVNNLEGVDLRPDWRTLNNLGDPEKIARYMDKENLKRIVLLEDFVGSGIQMTNAVRFAASIPNAPAVLLVPLMVAPSGASRARSLERDLANVTFSPVLSLQEEVFVYEALIPGEDSLYPLVRELAVRSYSQVSGGVPPDDNIKPYGPFGFGRDNPRAGALLVMYANCPDNTLPIIHHRSSQWKPLFPRSARA